MFQLYYFPNNASLAPHLILTELKVEFELVLVDRKTNAQRSTEYLALNPAGRIPTLIDQGQAIFESAAICMHLCEQYPQSGLMPAVGHPDRPLFLQWLMYLTNTVQAELMIYYYPERHTSDSRCSASIVVAQELRITEMFNLLNEKLTDKDYLLGDQISICDHYLFMLALWADEFATPPLTLPNLNRHLRNMAKREAVQQVCAKEQISLVAYQ